jgi:ABC-type transporter Mla subunit MlaD
MAIFRRNAKPEKPGVKEFNEGIYHRPPKGMSFFKTGVLALILILILSYFAYTKELPWADEGYTATATFADPATLRKTAPVRIAGVNVGKVTSVEREGDAAKVTFSVDEEGLPLHEDATITIRPRLFLEGNFFLDLRPGSPSAPELADGADIPMTQTATAVQLDQLLTSLQKPDRENLARLLDGYGGALDDKPTEQDLTQDPEVRNLSGAEAINRSFIYGARAGKGSSQVSQALLGEEAGDLRDMVNATSQVFSQLASRESDLRSLITNFNVTTGAFAAESQNLEATLSELAPFAEDSQEQLAVINTTFPPLRAFSRALTPGVKELPATIRAGNPWLEQARLLLRPSELGGIVNDLRIATPQLASGTNSLNSLLGELSLTSRCVSNVLDPTGDIVINDQFATGATNFREFFYGAAAQAGEGSNFDGNGSMLRIQPAGGPLQASTPVPGGFATIPGISPGDNVNYGNTITPPIGTQPLKPSGKPPIKTNVACHTQDVPDLNGPLGGIGAPNPAVDGGQNAVIP